MRNPRVQRYTAVVLYKKMRRAGGTINQHHLTFLFSPLSWPLSLCRQQSRLLPGHPRDNNRSLEEHDARASWQRIRRRRTAASAAAVDVVVVFSLLDSTNFRCLYVNKIISSSVQVPPGERHGLTSRRLMPSVL